MERTSLELKVGATILCALLILIFGVLWGKNYRLTTGQRPLKFLFENSGGLKPGDPVTVSGVKKGQVADIGLHRDRALVTVMLDRDIKLYPDVRAYITAVELMGGKKVEILPGTSGVPLDDAALSHPLPGSQTAGFAELLLVAGELAGRTTQLMGRLDSTVTLVNSLLDENRLQHAVHESVGDLRVTTNTLRRFLQDHEVLLHRVALNVDYTAQELREVVERRQQGVDSTLFALADASIRLNEFSKTLEDISHRMRRREGALGRLIYDDQMIENLERAILRVDSTAADLRQHLGRYISGANVNLFNLLSF
jgi:phospholipid/cholesterol/gamma-HCH transport system substrate-binding protein